MKSIHLFQPKLAALSALAFLSACSVGPDFKAPEPSPSQHYDPQAEQRLGAQQRIALGQKVSGQWWSALRSAKLDQVMRRAIDGNLELVAADATLRQASQAVAAAQGALYPQADFGATAGRQRVHNAQAPSTANIYAVGPRVGFDLDVFGGNQRLVEQRQAFTELQRHRFEAAYLTLTGEVASQALRVASANAQILAVEKLLANDSKNLELVRAARLNGSATRIDVSLAETRLAQDRTLLPPLAQQRQAAGHALSILAGKGPADWIAPDFHLDEFTLPSNVPVSLPSEMAHNRPDVRQAEAGLHIASAAVGVATANLYPRVTLSASFAQAASGNGAAALWGFAAGVAGPIFNGGSLKAEQQAAIEGYNAALAGYQQTVISSFGQVADTLQAINHDAEELRAQEEALQAAQTSLGLNQQAYALGETSILQVLEAERAYQQSLLGHVRAKTAQYLDIVQLFVALGGNTVGVGEQRIARHQAPQRAYQ
ncbi:Efflux transport system, outer membrane factor (OMF) lipoprotein [Pseudomonas sp. R2-37-08W]|uniref:efflux transporter outer membrane subunit n=1 Tax=unclassified Pseudomonas TaxID=196821 RepID=UPI000F57AA54|nr:MULTISPECIES: efflux transporter outer membrane subunit [unclassified Pseudomonas]AZF11085.1 Efflux transport system, outer membrane factor (OMF) lipoprotein [Pseudomonas sp. R2-37-08W]AZF37658.1 Efflux transport system, outer membrane factor (OMF) lipoprotein [Pseudomonas sp. R4-39-08]AZF42828.1 Efflux transport system, outer membrane factor (OMF) lipoprotein [Pseudomonas sp. R1-43-08]AZF48047.1 Efflux transport system, outer membrane factor (OMF) lipoprotein [Pseudomonas sp. R2-7-07]AZF58